MVAAVVKKLEVNAGMTECLAKLVRNGHFYHKSNASVRYRHSGTRVSWVSLFTHNSDIAQALNILKKISHGNYFSKLPCRVQCPIEYKPFEMDEIKFIILYMYCTVPNRKVPHPQSND